MGNDLVCVTVVPNEAAAEVACGALRAAGIASTYRVTNTAAAVWRSAGSLSGGPLAVLVAASDLDRAQKALGGPKRARVSRGERTNDRRAGADAKR